MKTTQEIRSSVGRRVLRGLHFVFLALTLICFWLAPCGQAVIPPPDGGYPNQNTAEGTDALFSLTTGGGNTAIGFEALFNNTTGDHNTAMGDFALYNNTVGSGNTAVGFEALFNNASGGSNTGSGQFALYRNTTGFSNTATGVAALASNTAGTSNTANGAFALDSNTTGHNNTAIGFSAVVNNTTGHDNTASGAFALFSNTTGFFNTATGLRALNYNTSGHDNTVDGVSALYNNTTGSGNIALGANAGQNLTTGDNNIDIGNAGVAGESNTIRVGTVGVQTATYVAGIMGKAVPMSMPVFVNASGLLGTTPSSARFKDAIKPMHKVSEAILALRPVMFCYKKEVDPDGIPQFGLVAEEVEKVNPALVARDGKGEVYTVRYEAVNAMLLNEFIKDHKKLEEQRSKIEQQEAIITELKSTVAQQQNGMEAVVARLNEQALQMRKVSARVEANNPAPQVVLTYR